jgi:hypothetical protein
MLLQIQLFHVKRVSIVCYYILAAVVSKFNNPDTETLNLISSHLIYHSRSRSFTISSAANSIK